MTLTEFLDETKQSATAFAAKVECEVSTITRILRGERKPSLDLALRIETVTEGKVAPGSFVQSQQEPAA